MCWQCSRIGCRDVEVLNVPPDDVREARNVQRRVATRHSGMDLPEVRPSAGEFEPALEVRSVVANPSGPTRIARPEVFVQGHMPVALTRRSSASGLWDLPQRREPPSVFYAINCRNSVI
jgi:hypothetical protein